MNLGHRKVVRNCQRNDSLQVTIKTNLLAELKVILDGLETKHVTG